MTMRFSPRLQKKARIEIIPMIDTMFFLLVFFMIATLSMTLQRGMPVNLPEAQSGTEKIPEQVTLSLTKEGLLFFNKEPISLDELGPRLHALLQADRTPSVLINADEAVSHGRVITVMDAVRTLGITHMAIATKPRRAD
ncbi:MAG: biopolymer transporter ExbD [Nitrospirae bacterium]|nr:MAG: biopolymer transporter ExbD [Nitrospirota bacterium]